jgi:hypothetical protein
MFENASRAKVSAMASTAEMARRRHTPNEVALLALQAMFLAIIVASLVAWLTPSNSRRSAVSGVGADSNCVSFGRGGAYCAGDSASDERSNRPSGAAEDCVSLGRGGLICNQRPGDAGDPG